MGDFGGPSGGEVIGSSYVVVRPQVDREEFTQQISGAVDDAGAAASGKLSKATANFNTQPMESNLDGAFGRAVERFKATLEYSGTYFAARSLVDQITDAFSQATSTQLLESRVPALFGDQSQKVLDYASQHAAAVDLTKNQALNAQVAFEQFFQSTADLSQSKGTQLAQQFTTLAGEAGLLVPAFGGAEGAAQALMRSVETGSSRGLVNLGVTFKQTDIEAEALAMGLVKPAESTDKITVATNKVKIAEDELAKARVGNKATAQQLADAQESVAITHTRWQEALAKGPANSLAAYEAQKSYNDAVYRYQQLQQGGPDPDQVLRAQNDLISAQDELAKATAGTVPPLNDQQRALATAQLILDRSNGLAQQFADAQGTTAQAAKQASVSWDEAKQKIVDQVLPQMTTGLNSLSEWIDKHPQVFSEIGSVLKTVFGDIGDTVQFLIDNKQIVEDIATVIAGLWVTDKAIGWKNSIEGNLKDLDKLYNNTIGKWFPNVFGQRGNQRMPQAPPEGTATAPLSMTVGDMTVATLIAENMVGGPGGGLPGKGGPKEGGREEPPVLYDQYGKPLPTSEPAEPSAGPSVKDLQIDSAKPTEARLNRLSGEGGGGRGGGGLLGAVVLIAEQGIQAEFQHERSDSKNFLNAVRDKNSPDYQHEMELMTGSKGDQAQAFRDFMDHAMEGDKQTADAIAQQYKTMDQDAAYRRTVIGQMVSLIDSEQADMADLAHSVEVLAQQQANIHEQTIGLRGAQLSAGVGTVTPGGVGTHRSFDVGGPVRETGPATVHAGELVLTPGDQVALLQALRGGGLGQGGMRDVNVYHPTSDVDVMTALERDRNMQWLAEGLGVIPAGYDAHLQLAGA